MFFGGRDDRQAEFQPLQRLAGAGGRLLGEVAERLEVAVALGQHVGEVGRHLGVDRLQVDHVVALDHAQAQSFIRFKSYDLHGYRRSLVC